jgi:Tol biopolymer transport system component
LPQRVVGPCSFHAGSAALSPDGTQIAYTQYALNSDGVITSRLHLMNANGTDVRTLIEPPGQMSRPSWSPDDSRFAVEVLSERSAILIFDQSGKRLSAIGLENPARMFHEVSWSPDGEMLAFSDGNLDDRGASTNIFVANLDGSDRTQLTKNGPGAYALSPAWSPDGKRIAFLESVDGATALRIIATDGSPLAAFQMNDFENLAYAWSPDGARLAVTANARDGQSLSLIDVDSGAVTRLVDQLGFLVGPVWSPDGRQIAFTAFNTKSYEDLFGGFSITGGAARSDLFVVNADGTGLSNLTNAPRQDDFTAYPLICAQCPYVYTYRADRQEWAYDTTMLYQLVGKQNERLQVRALQNFDGRLLIREVEPEISYIDQLYVIVTDGDGHAHTLPAQLDRLRDADGRYVVLRTGDELLVTFEGFDQIRSPQQASVAAQGYYDPLTPGLVPVP